MTIQSAIFDTRAEAQEAISQLRNAGVPDDAISVIASHDDTTRVSTVDGEVTEDENTNLIRGIFGGGALGAGLGVAALAIPGVGPLAAIGSIAAAAAPAAMGVGAVAGATLGSINEVLKDHGLSDADSEYYGERIKDGSVLVTVDTDQVGSADLRSDDVLYNAGGHNSTRMRT